MEQKILQKQKRYIIAILAEMEWHRLAIRVYTRERVPKKDALIIGRYRTFSNVTYLLQQYKTKAVSAFLGRHRFVMERLFEQLTYHDCYYASDESAACFSPYENRLTVLVDLGYFL